MLTPSPLSLTARTLYAELRELSLAMSATEHIGPMPGSVVRKTLKGADYLYYQYRDLDGRTRQAYLGPDDQTTHILVSKLDCMTKNREEDLARLNELRAAFVGAGGTTIEHAPLRVIRAFVDAGALQPGMGYAVLIGTHAFNVLSNFLGVRWSSQMQTQDIDMAGATDIDVAISRPDTPAADVLKQLEMGFIPVPTLDPRQASTSFRVRGQDLRVDLLTPLVGKPSKRGHFVPALNAVAEPLPFLDYLVDTQVAAVVVGKRSQALINVPLPERFALHKLLVAESRSSAFATKAVKDRQQAMQVLSVLMDDAPDGVAVAKSELMARGKSWTSKLETALRKCGKSHPDIVDWIKSL